MGIRFSNTASQALIMTATTGVIPVAYPFSVGLWVKPQSSGLVAVYWSSSNNSATSGQCFYIGHTAISTFVLNTTATTFNNLSIGSMSTGKWYYLIGRWISSTNRRFSVWNSANDAYFVGSNTTSITPNSLDSMLLGGNYLGGATATAFFTGEIAEFWWANKTNWFAEAENLPKAVHKQIALNGPFFYQKLGGSVKQYWSLRNSYNNIHGPDVFFDNTQGNRPLPWVSRTESPSPGAHPPVITEAERESRIPGRQYFHVATASATATATGDFSTLRTLAATGAGLAIAGAAVLPNLPWAKKNKWAA